ncbi:MAG: hypothetical protein GY765_11335, partial [bacterium]|nr:hypothetical protein [bacterium]
MCYAVILDTASIQQYIFSGKQLKENIGASFLVKEAFESMLLQVLHKIASDLKTAFTKEDWNRWKTVPETIPCRERPIDIGYIGGGNAIVYFTEKDHADQLVKEWTLQLLQKAPGLQTSTAVMKFDLENFQSELVLLHDKLKENSHRLIPQTVIPGHGITASCVTNGF